MAPNGVPAGCARSTGCRTSPSAKITAAQGNCRVVGPLRRCPLAIGRSLRPREPATPRPTRLAPSRLGPPARSRPRDGYLATHALPTDRQAINSGSSGANDAARTCATVEPMGSRPSERLPLLTASEYPLRRPSRLSVSYLARGIMNANAGREPGDSNAFQIEQKAADSVEVRMFDVVYEYVNRTDQSRLSVSRDGRMIEQSEMARVDGVTRLYAWHESGATMQLATSVDGKTVKTLIELGGTSLKVSSDLASHGIELAHALRGVKGPPLRYIRRFGRAYARNIEFRGAMKSRQMLMPNGGMGSVCGWVCSCCLIAIPDPIPGDEVICCTACAACLIA